MQLGVNFLTQYQPMLKLQTQTLDLGHVLRSQFGNTAALICMLDRFAGQITKSCVCNYTLSQLYAM